MISVKLARALFSTADKQQGRGSHEKEPPDHSDSQALSCCTIVLPRCKHSTIATCLSDGFRLCLMCACITCESDCNCPRALCLQAMPQHRSSSRNGCNTTQTVLLFVLSRKGLRRWPCTDYPVVASRSRHVLLACRHLVHRAPCTPAALACDQFRSL